MDPLTKVRGCNYCNFSVVEAKDSFWIYCPTCGKKLKKGKLRDFHEVDEYAEPEKYV